MVSSIGDAIRIAGDIGYPVIIKASGGGGGRGMRIANDDQELADVFAIARERPGGIRQPRPLYRKIYLQAPPYRNSDPGRSPGNMVHLGERECSIQKRYQKLIEESPSPFVDPDLRMRMGEAAIQVAKAFNYQNAGTIEFLVDEHKNFYFMEINARVQVEHPVTEMVTGIDIVQEQIKIAAGQPLAFGQEDIRVNGWAIECRINAADPDNDFIPSPGKIESIMLPSGPGVRMDTHIFNHYTITPFYDSLLGKLIVWAPDRSMAIMRLKRALAELHVEGIKTTTHFYERVVDDPDFRVGNIDTHFLERLTP